MALANQDSWTDEEKAALNQTGDQGNIGIGGWDPKNVRKRL